MTSRGADRSFSDDAIVSLVHEFYGRVRADEVLGPIFERRVDDWPHHLGRMVCFWKAVLRGEPTFQPSPRGPPPLLHRRIDELSRAHFDRWLAIFADVASTTFPAQEAEAALDAARRIAVALARHLPPPDETAA